MLKLIPLRLKIRIGQVSIYKTVPMELKAVPRPGYKFVRWEGSVETDSKSISIIPKQDLYLTPVFEKNRLVPKIVINEINYNSDPDFESGDWVELFNNENFDIELTGYYFMNSITPINLL